MASKNDQLNQEKSQSDYSYGLNRYDRAFKKIKLDFDNLEKLEKTSQYTLSELCEEHERIESEFIRQKYYYDAFSEDVFESKYYDIFEKKLDEINEFIYDIYDAFRYKLKRIRDERMKKTSHLTAQQASRQKFLKAFGLAHNNATVIAASGRRRGGTYSDNLKRYKRHTKRNKRNKRKTRRSKH